MQKNYNTQQPQVKLPEYGRNVQNLVAYCKTIPDRQKRTRYAYGIVGIMADLNPEAEKVENLEQVLWAHLARIANYELDIDYPFPISKEEQQEHHPEPLGNPQSNSIAWRMYGKTIEGLVQHAMAVEDREQRIRLFERCANHMKLHFHITHPNADEDDNKIIHDLMDYTQGQFQEDVYQVLLYSFRELEENCQYDPKALVAVTKKKKKKKKK